MSRFHRKTAPGVRDGRTLCKNNWKQSPSLYTHSQPELVVDRRKPGAGYRHILMKRDIERFVRLIPDWNTLVVGLDVIVLDCGRPSCDGWYDRGVIGICAWPTARQFDADWDWYCDHRPFLARIGASVEGSTPCDIVIRWTPSTARAYQLCHVFLHELGHHLDRMTTRSRRECSRGEGFAENYAWEYEALIWDRYLEEFGLPE